MIPNPPNIQLLLRGYQNMVRLGATGTHLEDMLSVLFKAFLGNPPFDTFLRTYQLYLQSIPLATAKAAWGLNAARQPLTKPTP